MGSSFWLWFSCSVTSSKTQPFRGLCSVRLLSSSLLVCDLRKAVASPDGSFILSEAGKMGGKDKWRSPHRASPHSPPDAGCFLNLTGSRVCFYASYSARGVRSPVTDLDQARFTPGVGVGATLPQSRNPCVPPECTRFC